ncbi:MAG: TlpA family protein disulfide reductase [Candidatus Methylomirabilales bacterium]
MTDPSIIAERATAQPIPSPRRWWRVALALAPVLAFLGILAYGFTRDPRAIPSPLVGRPAPDFQMTLFDGSQVRLSEFRGRVVFLNFWASWCPPCRAEAPLLEAAWRHYRDRGVVFLGVNIQDREASARGFLEEFGITYPNGRDPRNRVAIDYGVYGLPETFYISPDGLITYKHIGAIGEATLAQKMEEALRGVASAEGRSGDYRSIR